MRPLRILLATVLLIVLAASIAGGQGAERAPVRVIELDSGIDPVSASFVERRIDDAEDAGAAAVVIELDTPGGLISATRDIVADMESATVPVTVWVGPSGARAGSAGAYISAAADHLGMAPGTNIGSATPISSGGEDLDSKVVNDAAASIAALAAEHGRNQAAYRAMVEDALNLTADEALAQDVIDTVQPSRADFIAWLDGRPSRAGGTIATAGAPVEVDSLAWYQRLLQALTNPNLVLVLLIVGLAGLGIEALSPGVVLPGVIGAISLLLALAGLAVLPVDWVGAALIVLAIGLFFAEAHVGGFGALAAGGVVALALGGAFLFDSDDPALEASPWIAGAAAVVIGGGFAVAAHRVLRARRQPVVTGDATLVGEEGVAREALSPGGGRVWVNGEIWAARTRDGVVIPAGAPVRVVRVHTEDLTVTVEPREG